MGLLGIPTKGNKGKYYNKNGEYICDRKANYSNVDAVENLLRYVTRTRENEERANDLINYGAVGADYFHSVDGMIQQFRYIQYIHGINSRRGCRMYHEVLNLTDCEWERLGHNAEMIWWVGMECCQIYYQKGHQAVFAVHWEPEKRCHIHFAVNTINYLNGLKWHTSLAEIKERGMVFNESLRKYQIMATGAIEPLEFINKKNDEGDALCGQAGIPFEYPSENCYIV